MGQKKDTLLRWVNCCLERTTPIDRIKNLSDGAFFIHILNFLRSHPTDESNPWLQTISILREYKLQDDVVDYDAAAAGNEDELAKLIVICMHLTMVQKPCEVIKEKTMLNLSTEDQKVIEAILLAIVNDDHLTRNRLIEVLQDLQETSFTKPVMFYTSSPLSSMSKNSPLKRFLDSPMALRLTRLQKEISDKNEEIRRLQGELLTESDETSALSLRMDELKKKVKDMEKKNAELEQRLRDCQLPDFSGPDSDIEINQLKKQLKKMQNEYEASCQKYYDLSVEYEAMKSRQEKDRKQIRQLHLDLNDTVARFERESAEYQILLDSIRTENVELKHALEEKAQWIDVLEEKSRSCSELHARLNAPRSPCERESIGFSLLSMETEKLQDELESYRRDLARQSDKFDSEKQVFQQRAATLEEEKRGLHRQVEEANHTNQTLQSQLDQAKCSLQQLSLGCNSLSLEKEELRHSLDALQTEFQKEMSRAQQQFDIRAKEALDLGIHIESLNRQLEETQSAKNAAQLSIQELSQQKMELNQKMTDLEQSHLELQFTLSTNEIKFQGELDDVSGQLQLSKQQIADQSQSITQLEEKLQSLRGELAATEESSSLLTAEKQQLIQMKMELEQRNSLLTSAFESSKQEFEARLEKANGELESATTRIADFIDTTSSLKSQLEAALQEKQLFQTRSTQLESDRNQLCQERDLLQQEVQQLLQSAQLSQEEKDGLLMELESKKNEISDQASRILVAEQRHQEATKQIAHLEETVRSLEQETAELLTSRSFFDQQISILQAAVDTGKTALQAAVNQAKEEAEVSDTLVTQHKETIHCLQVRLESLSEEKQLLESQTVELGAERESLQQQLASLENSRKCVQASHDELVEELKSLQETTQQHLEVHHQDMAQKLEELAAMEMQLKQATKKESELEADIGVLNDEKIRLIRENGSLKEEVTQLVSSINNEKTMFETNLNTLKEELLCKQKTMEESQLKMQHMESELVGLVAHKSSLESKVEKLSAECCKMTEERSHLEEENHRQVGVNKEQLEQLEHRISLLTVQHNGQITQLDEQLGAAQQLNLVLKGDCARLERERETLHFEKSGFEQMYLEVKAAYEETENKMQVENELTRQEMEAKEKQMTQQSAALEKLECMVNSLRQQKEDAETRYALQIQLLEDEKQELTSINATVSKLQFDLSVAVEEKNQLTNEMSVLQAVQGEMKNLELAMEQLTTEIHELSCKKANLEQLREVLEIAKANAEDECAQLRQDVQCKEVEIGKLAGRIEETQSNLEQSQRDKQALQDRISDLESTVSNLNNNATETSQAVLTLEKQLQEREVHLKRSIEELNSEKKQSAEAQAAITQIKSDLKDANDANRRALESSIAELQREIDAEKQLTSEQTNSIQVLTEAKKEASELAASLQRKNSEMEAEMDRLFKSEVLLKKENAHLEETAESNQLRLETEKKDLAQSLKTMELQISQLTLQLEKSSSSYTEMETECNRLKSNQMQAAQVKAHLEQMSREVEANLQCTVAKLQTRMKNMEEELKTKSDEIVKLSATTEDLKLQLETVVKKKDSLERDLTGRVSALTTEKESLISKTASFEEENQGLRAELAVEKSKTAQGKSEVILEHRKEKAALEARLQIAQTQMKSMQEKLVNMTVANNSQAPLEHKISMLTSELEATIKAKCELEKKFEDSMLHTKEEAYSVKKEELESRSSKASTINQDSDSESTVLRKKYDSAKKMLVHKDQVINQYAANFEKMQTQLNTLSEEIDSAKMEKRKLALENRSLKTEQQHLLAQIAADKDKANARNTRQSLALQRGHTGSEGGTLADTMMDARRRSLRPTRSEIVPTANTKRQPPAEVFRPPSLAFGDGSDANSIFKVPPSRRDSSSSICSNRSDVSITSRGTNVPHGAGRLFTCDDEDGELFSSSYLNEMKEGKCRVEDSSNRVSELHRRNTMQPPHMRSAYPVEINDERLRQSEMTIYEQPMATSSRADNNNDTLQQSMSMLSMNTPPAMNTRKRRSSSWNRSDMETPVMQPRKRRSYELDADVSSNSSDTRLSISSSAERRKHRDASQTSYQRPGPPTPAKNSTKENSSMLSTPSMESSSSKASTKSNISKRTSPTRGAKSSKLTPAALVKKVQAKLRSNNQSSSEQNTPSSTRTTPRGSKLNIFRRPLGSRGYNNSDAAK